MFKEKNLYIELPGNFIVRLLILPWKQLKKHTGKTGDKESGPFRWSDAEQSPSGRDQ